MSNARRVCVCFYLMQVMGQFLPRLCFHSERTFSRIPCFITNDSAISVPPPLGGHINAEKALDCSDQRLGLPSGFFHVETGARLVPLLKLCFRHSMHFQSLRGDRAPVCTKWNLTLWCHGLCLTLQNLSPSVD